MLESAAKQVDNHIQAVLVSEMMNRYAEVSREIKARNRQLFQSDMNRREARKSRRLGALTWTFRTQRIAWSDTMRKILEVRRTRNRASNGT
jgi:hypothetical protein